MKVKTNMLGLRNFVHEVAVILPAGTTYEKVTINRSETLSCRGFLLVPNSQKDHPGCLCTYPYVWNETRFEILK